MPTNVCPATRPVTGIEVPTDGVAGLNDTKVEPDSAYACLKIVIVAFSYRGVRRLPEAPWKSVPPG
jgi:hypothetical protein